MAPDTENQNSAQSVRSLLARQSTKEIARTVLRTGARIVGPVPLADEEDGLHGAAFAARRQEVTRAV